METEQNKITFLDMLVQRKTNSSLGHQVYRKPTHTDRYLHATFHYHPFQIQSVISLLVYRSLIISQFTSLDSELAHITETVS